MRLNLDIALGFLLAKRRAMLMSLAGIVFGVAFFILTQAQTSGFEKLFIRTILGTNGHLRIQDEFRPSVDTLQAQVDGASGKFAVPLRNTGSWQPGIQKPDQLIQKVRQFSSVAAVAEVLRERADVSNSFRTEQVQILGIRPREYLQVSNLEQQITAGSITDFADQAQGIILGVPLAERLGAELGGTVFLRGVGEQRRFRVVALFRTGVDEYDKRSAFVHMTAARQVFNKPNGSSYLQVNLIDPALAPVVAEQMEQVVKHYCASWQEREATWLELFRVLRISSGITTSVILLIAGLGMFNTLAIIVMERVREIAILRSMGYTRRDVALIFIYQGLIVLVAGLVLGMGLAVFLTWGIEQVPINIRGIFASSHFVVHWSIWHYVTAFVVASIVVGLASVIPARRAAAFEPGAIIRGSST